MAVGPKELLIVLAVLILMVLLIAFLVSRRSRAYRNEEPRERARREFGSEYERAAEERGSEEAESELRRRRVERQVAPLPRPRHGSVAHTCTPFGGKVGRKFRRVACF